jgi:Peptidase family S41
LNWEAKLLNKREVLAGFGLAFIGHNVSAQPIAPGSVLTPSALQSDLALLKRVYTNLHPGLYRYSTPAQIKSRFERLSRKFTRPTTLRETYLDLSMLLSSVRCGHSYANFYSQSRDVQNALFAGTNRLPFRFVWLNRMIVVTDPAGVNGLVRGSRITSINGLATREILASLLPYVRADGNNIDKQISLLSVDRDEGYQTFDIFYALHFDSPAVFELQGLSPEGKEIKLRVPAIDLTARRAMTASPALAADGPRWQLDVKTDKTAILTMPSWGLYRTTWDWKAWLAASFAQLDQAGAQKLVIDIRGNEGGRDDCGPEVLGYLTDKALPPQAGRRRLRYQKIEEDLNAILETWDNSFRDWGAKVAKASDNMYDIIDQEGRSGGGATPKATHFKGKVIVLTDATNSSATLQFCQMLRANGLGKVVGGTTGGNLRGINAEKFMFCRLPATGLEVDVPLVGFFPDGSTRDGGLVPDVVVTRTWQDVARGYDRVMDTALKDAT